MLVYQMVYYTKTYTYYIQRCFRGIAIDPSSHHFSACLTWRSRAPKYMGFIDVHPTKMLCVMGLKWFQPIPSNPHMVTIHVDS